MKYAIIASITDPAGMNIYHTLIENYNFRKAGEIYQKDNIELIKIEEDSIYCDGIDKKTNAEIIIFASKHKSSSGKNSLSLHIPGNWGKADLGGRKSILCKAPPSLLKELFIELNKQGRNSQWEITLE